MLGIKLKTSSGREFWFEWHIGEPIPEDIGRVVTFQADGDELNLFLDAMVASRGEHPRVDYRKMEGFTAKQPVNPPEPKLQYRIWYTPVFEDSATTTDDIIPATSTGIVRKTRRGAARWIEANPARGGTWSIREENA